MPPDFARNFREEIQKSGSFVGNQFNSLNWLVAERLGLPSANQPSLAIGYDAVGSDCLDLG
jgi:hypothetical protein